MAPGSGVGEGVGDGDGVGVGISDWRVLDRPAVGSGGGMSVGVAVCVGVQFGQRSYHQPIVMAPARPSAVVS
jgi:hypothetical protein